MAPKIDRHARLRHLLGGDAVLGSLDRGGDVEYGGEEGSSGGGAAVGAAGGGGGGGDDVGEARGDAAVCGATGPCVAAMAVMLRDQQSNKYGTVAYSDLLHRRAEAHHAVETADLGSSSSSTRVTSIYAHTI
uniref:Uncharacterized protein n=1 Tax=Arundo donax TaxID=35708 RepID=A0A0A9GII2_ARUDO